MRRSITPPSSRPGDGRRGALPSVDVRPGLDRRPDRVELVQLQPPPAEASAEAPPSSRSGTWGTAGAWNTRAARARSSGAAGLDDLAARAGRRLVRAYPGSVEAFAGRAVAGP